VFFDILFSGHAIEALMQPTMLHGEAVSIGMIEEALLSQNKGLINHAAIRRLENVCKGKKLKLNIHYFLIILYFILFSFFYFCTITFTNF
jgi:3-dehydroquinate synthetase